MLTQDGDYTAQQVGADPAGTAEGLVKDHNGSLEAHKDLFTALEDRHRRHVIATRERDPSKPDYGLDGDGPAEEPPADMKDGELFVRVVSAE